jgi:hypothetical protein
MSRRVYSLAIVGNVVEAFIRTFDVSAMDRTTVRATVAARNADAVGVVDDALLPTCD